MAAGENGALIDVRALTELHDLNEAVRLQKAIWGFDDIDLLPVRLFVVAGKIGGQVLGAFDGRKMVGFLIAIPGVKPGGKPYLHSHMLGVTHDYRNAGVGRVLKMAQRTDALERGLDLIEWTFDPLELKNAYFNIERLGAIVRRHVLNQYGITSNQFDSGLPSDRCIAEWWVESPRARAIAGGEGTWKRPPVEARIVIPAEIAVLRREDPPRAREIQRRASLQFQDYFSRGMAVVGFERTDSDGIYLLSKWDSE
jgi:predicted GNAT superfamily acetyltransferase